MFNSIQFNSTDPTGKPNRPANWGAKVRGQGGARRRESHRGSPQLLQRYDTKDITERSTSGEGCGIPSQEGEPIPRCAKVSFGSSRRSAAAHPPLPSCICICIWLLPPGKRTCAGQALSTPVSRVDHHGRHPGLEVLSLAFLPTSAGLTLISPSSSATIALPATPLGGSVSAVSYRP